MVPISSPVKRMLTAGITVPLQAAFPKAKCGKGVLGPFLFQPRRMQSIPISTGRHGQGAQHLREAIKTLLWDIVG